MLIKGNKQTKQAPNQNEAGLQSVPGEAGLPELSETEINWSQEAVETGLLPERRKPTKGPDRRRGYRRIEEKDLISKASEEASAIRENAQREGFEEGLRQSEELLAELRNTIEHLLNAREEALLSAADDIGALAVEIAERIIKTEVTCDSSLVLALVRDTILKTGRQAKTILIKVHPDDVTTVKQSLKDDPIPNLRAELIVMEDGAVDQGSCIVETNSGLVDASFATQLGILHQLFGTVDRSS